VISNNSVRENYNTMQDIATLFSLLCTAAHANCITRTANHVIKIHKLSVYTAWDWNNGDLTEEHFITSACSQGPMLAASQQLIPHVVSDKHEVPCAIVSIVYAASSGAIHYGAA
jgi:hypothetical protein